MGDNNIPDQGVDLDGVNIVQLLQSSLDLTLVGLDIDDEDKGVVLLDLLHGALGVKRVQDDLGSVELGLTGDRDAGVLGGPRELQGLGAVEGGRGANLAGLVKLLRVLVLGLVASGAQYIAGSPDFDETSWVW